MAFEELSLRSNGIAFHALAAGPEAGPLVLLLHGFPELAVSWRSQLPALAAAGYRAVAPDMRGYGRTERRGPYDLRTLAFDVAGLVRALGRERAVLVGHDWGGAAAWATAFLQPQAVERLCVLNCPHPAILARALIANPRQLLRSWYMLFFLVPWLPERLISRGRGGEVARALRGGSAREEVWTDALLEPYREAFSTPGAAQAALGYYRAAFRHPLLLRGAAERKITCPTHILWGTADRFLGRELIAQAAMRLYFATGNTPGVELIEGAGHFVQNEAPEEVNQALLRWLGPIAPSIPEK